MGLALHRSWEEERATLQAQIEALKREGGTRISSGRRRTTAADGSEDGEMDEELQDLRDQLNEALEKEVSTAGLL